MSSRALPDLVARIRVDSSGVDQAIGSLVHSFGRADLAMAGLAAGIGILVLGGKSMIDIAEKHDAAERNLTQALESRGRTLASLMPWVNSFIASNRAYLSDQALVIEGYAKLTRAGLTQAEVERDMGRALDLAALKHIDLSQAVDLVNMAEHGRFRGLVDLGIVSAKYVDSTGHVIKANHSAAHAMAELDAKTKGGRDTLTSLQKHANALSNDWQDLSNKGGPVLITLLDTVVTGVSAIYDEFDKIGKDDRLWSAISDRLVKMAQWLHDYIIGPINDFFVWLDTNQQKAANRAASSAGRYGYGGASNFTTADQNPSKSTPRAGGGPVIPNRIYTIGEDYAETLVMGPAGTGGYVMPGGGRQSRGGTTYSIVVHVAGSVSTERELVGAIREGIRRSDRAQR